jgi:hypothetical protein
MSRPRLMMMWFPHAPSSYKEVHHSPAWWAELWDFDPSIVRSLALEEKEGVLRCVSKATATKRRKVTQKIAESAAQRIYRKLEAMRP